MLGRSSRQQQVMHSLISSLKPALAPLGVTLALSCGRFGYETMNGGRQAVAGQSSLGNGGQAMVGSNAGAGGGSVIPGSGGSSGALTMAGASGSAGVVPAGDICREIPAFTGVPLLDGALDPGLELDAVVPVGWRGFGTVPAGYAMSYATAWLADGLYFFIHVDDPDRNPAPLSEPSWEGDGVEIYVDSDAVYPPAGSWDDPGARQLIVAAPGDAQAPSTRAEWYTVGGVSAAWTPTSFVCVPTTTGYDLEAYIRAVDLGLPSWSLRAGDRVGIDLAHNVSLPSGESSPLGNRDSQYFLHLLEPPLDDGYDYPFLNENAFCTAVLRDR